jgi:hypothetical protein
VLDVEIDAAAFPNQSIAKTLLHIDITQPALYCARRIRLSYASGIGGLDNTRQWSILKPLLATSSDARTNLTILCDDSIVASLGNISTNVF